MCTYLEWNSVASLRNPRPGCESTTSWISITKSSGAMYFLTGWFLMANNFLLLMVLLLSLNWLLPLLKPLELKLLDCLLFDVENSVDGLDKKEKELEPGESEFSLEGLVKLEAMSAAFVTTKKNWLASSWLDWHIFLQSSENWDREIVLVALRWLSELRLLVNPSFEDGSSSVLVSLPCKELLRSPPAAVNTTPFQLRG